MLHVIVAMLSLLLLAGRFGSTEDIEEEDPTGSGAHVDDPQGSRRD